MYSRVAYLCVIVALGSTATVGAIYWVLRDAGQPYTAGTTILLELAKTLTQLALIGVIGAVVKAAFDRYAAEKETREKEKADDLRRREAHIEVRKTLWRELREVYAQVETARNLIEGAKSALTYGEQLRKIMGLRSRLGEIRHEVFYSPEVFVQRETLRDQVKGMEKYLKLLIDEYGARYRQLSMRQSEYEAERKRGHTSIDMDAELNSLPVLRDFREAPEKPSGQLDGTFSQDFRMNYFKSRQSMIAQILQGV